MKWTDVKNLLKIDELRLLVKQELARSVEHWSAITEVKPVSDKMKELFEYQAGYFLNKKAKQRGQ